MKGVCARDACSTARPEESQVPAAENRIFRASLVGSHVGYEEHCPKAHDSADESLLQIVVFHGQRWWHTLAGQPQPKFLVGVVCQDDKLAATQYLRY